MSRAGLMSRHCSPRTAQLSTWYSVEIKLIDVTLCHDSLFICYNTLKLFYLFFLYAVQNKVGSVLTFNRVGFSDPSISSVVATLDWFVLPWKLKRNRFFLLSWSFHHIFMKGIKLNAAEFETAPLGKSPKKHVSYI